jgi:tetratricopeptide (TPR) repeat protein
MRIRAPARFFVVTTIVVAATAFGAYVAWPRLFPSVLARAAAAYKRGDWSTAAALADGRLKTTPGDREALRLLARAAARQGRDRTARALYGRIGGAEAMDAEDLYLFGTVIDRTGDHDTARDCWQAGLRADPNHPELLDQLARIAWRSKQYAQAAGLAARLAGRPGWEARGDLLRGQIAFEQDDPATAAECLQRALSRDPSGSQRLDPHARYRKLLARALLRIGRAGDARSALEGIPMPGPDPEAAWLLSRAALQSGDSAEASAALKQGGESYRSNHPVEPEPAPYVGSARCAECHAPIHRNEQNSLHAQTFRRAPELGDLPIPAQPLGDPARAEVRHTIERSRDQVLLKTVEPSTAQSALVDYIFGSGHRGLTLVGHDERGRERELRLSHYADGPAWDVTTGHPAKPPQHEGYLGRFLSVDDLYGCLFCHTTVARSAHDRHGPEAADRGIGCERCHGPGGNHLKAVATRSSDLAIGSPGPASGAEVVALCAQCHGPFGREVSRTDPLAVRLPGTTLTWSRCYLESGGTFDCRTCHDPHRDLETAPAHYEAKCLACHTAPKAKDTAGSVRATECPVNSRRDCVSCHMPKVKTAIPHAVFTDHHIRVHPRSENSAGSQ